VPGTYYDISDRYIVGMRWLDRGRYDEAIQYWKPLAGAGDGHRMVVEGGEPGAVSGPGHDLDLVSAYSWLVIARASTPATLSPAQRALAEQMSKLGALRDGPPAGSPHPPAAHHAS